MAILVHGQDPVIVDLSDTVDNIHDTDLPAIKTTVDDIHNTELPAVVIDLAVISAGISTLTTMVSALAMDIDTILQVQLDEAADAGDVVLGTVDGSVLIESITVKTKTTHANLTSIAVTGGAGKVVEFISSITGAAANLNAADKQVSWTGNVELGDSKTIVITFAGTGAGHVTMTATIKYKPCTALSTIV
jgi:hypothetical protein